MRRVVVAPSRMFALGCAMRGCSKMEAFEYLNATERQRIAEEEAVHARNVIFATGSSGDHRPRMAAAEAYDLAATALPRAPNFCMLNISLDHSAMVDAPEVVWYNLCKSNGLNPNKADSKVSMIGSAVLQQRLAHGYLQVTLGIIPDLEMDVFTFDAVPTKEQVEGMSVKKPFACIAQIDASLALAHDAAITEKLGQLRNALPTDCPLAGAVLPPTRPVVKEGPSVESLFFFNDRVYKGSAAAAILRSSSIRSHCFSVCPGISIGTAVVGGVEAEGLLTRRISLLSGVKATDAIRLVYEKELADNETSKVFIAVKHNDSWIPLTFRGDVETGKLTLCLPMGADIREGDTIEYFVDDLKKDTEAAGGLLLQQLKNYPPTSALKDVTVAREGRRNITASSCAGFHYSHRLMNVIGRQSSDMITLSPEGAFVFAPSVISRCIGNQAATGGFYCPGQITTVANTCGVGSRSSTFLILEGLN